MRAVKRGQEALALLVWLSGRSELEVLVYGPVPDCRRLGRIAREGHEGRNRVLFRGRVAGEPLDSGLYVLHVRRANAPRDSFFRVPVRIVERRREPGLVVRLARSASRCGGTHDALAGASFASMGFGGGALASAGRLGGEPGEEATGGLDGPRGTFLPPTAPGDATGSGDDDAVVEAVPTPPGDATAGHAGDVPAAISFMILALLAGSLLFIVVYVTRFLQRPD